MPIDTQDPLGIEIKPPPPDPLGIEPKVHLPDPLGIETARLPAGEGTGLPSSGSITGNTLRQAGQTLAGGGQVAYQQGKRNVQSMSEQMVAARPPMPAPATDTSAGLMAPSIGGDAMMQPVTPMPMSQGEKEQALQQSQQARDASLAAQEQAQAQIHNPVVSAAANYGPGLVVPLASGPAAPFVAGAQTQSEVYDATERALRAKGVPQQQREQLATEAGLGAGAVSAGAFAVPGGKTLGRAILQNAAVGAAQEAGTQAAERSVGAIDKFDPLGILKAAAVGGVVGAAGHGAKAFADWWRARGAEGAPGAQPPQPQLSPAGSGPREGATGAQAEAAQPQTPDLNRAAQILGINLNDPDVHLDDVERAARAAYLRTHPDRGGNQADFQAVTEAADLLKRRYANRVRPASQQQPRPEQPAPAQPTEAQPQQQPSEATPPKPAPESQPQAKPTVPPAPQAEPVHPAVQSVREAAAEVVRNDGLDSPALKPLREAEAALKPTQTPAAQPTGEPHAVQEPGPAQVPVRKQPQGGARVSSQNTQGQETAPARPQGEAVAPRPPSDLTREDLAGARPMTDAELEAAAPSGSGHRPSINPDEPLVSQDERDALTAPLEDHAATTADTLTRPQPTSANEAAIANPTRQLGTETQPASFGTIDAPDRNALGRHFAAQLDAGRSYPTIHEARQEASQLLGGEVKPGTPAAKHVDEAVEIGVTRAARNIIGQGAPPHQTFNKLVDLYQRQPNLGVRTSTSMAQQAYSTPAPLAYAASRMAGITPNSTVYEPTAGNGMLLVGANPALVHANELNPDRADTLRKQDFPVSTFDATDHAPAGKFDAVIANPPFGAVKAGQQRKTWNIDGVKTAEVDHAIALRALQAMKDDGHAVLILGAKGMDAKTPIEKRKAYLNRSSVAFYRHLYNNYNVTGHYTINGDLYSRQGASFPVDLISIDGKGKAKRQYPWQKPPDAINSWQELEHVIPSEITRPGTGAPAKVETGMASAGQQPDDHNHPPARQRPRDEPVAVHGAAQGETPRPGGGERRPGHRQPGIEPANSGAGALGDRGPAVAGERPQPAGGSGGGRLLRPGAAPAPARPEPEVAAAGEQSGGSYGGIEGSQPLPVDHGSAGAQRQSRVKLPKSDEETEHQVTYQPASEAQGLGTLVPKNMATATQDALDRVEKEQGDLNQFVAKALGYDPAKLGDYFGAEQIDALALAIQNHKEGAGFILGDQTGVGKGRVVAAMMRYAKRQNLLPVFITKAPNLYADMMRDLEDIGMNPRSKPFEILPTNTLTGDKKIPLPDGRTLATTGNHKDVFLNAVKHFLDGEGLTAAVKGGQKQFDAIFTTYSQLQDVQGNATFRQQTLRQLRKQAYFILDESHEAGGTRKSGWQKKDEPAVGGRAGFIRDILKDAPGVLYSSATYAKRPEVMDLYGRTDMRLAVDNLDKLPEAIAKGGVPLQQAVAAMLAKSGQYVRRERSYKGVNFDVRTVDVGLDRADKVSAILRAIREFDEIKQGVKGEMEDDLVGEGSTYGTDTSTGEAGITSTNFTSLLWNLVDQMLLTLKSDAMADEAIAAVKRGAKPVIVMDNTMGSALDRYVQEKNIRPGERVDLDFRRVLQHYLERSREVVIRDQGGNGTQHYLTDKELGPAGVAAYQRAAKLIEQSTLDLPASPIDRVIQRLEAAGIKVGEITGRANRMRYAPDGSATLAVRPKDEVSAAGRVRTVNGFNGGDLDALIMNRSGSTGLSIHASARFADQRPRHMIIGQAARNIDDFMQMLGRIHRTGQVAKPSFGLLVSNAPAENRLGASLAKKLGGLNANVTAESKGAISFDVPDILNQVGDQVVADYMGENEELSEMMGDPVKTDAEGKAIEGAAAKASGRAVLLPVADQERFWDDIIQRYAAKIDELDAVGENPLVARTLNLDAVTLRTMKLFDGKRSSGSPFAGPANLEEVDMKLVGKPFTAEQVSQKLRDFYKVERDGQVAQARGEWARRMVTQLGERTAEYQDKRIASIEKQDVAQRVSADIQSNLDAVTRAMDLTPPGTPIQLTTPGGDFFNGVVIGFEQRGKPKNPAAAGSWVIHVALADAARQIKVPISATMRGTDSYILAPDYGRRLVDALPDFDHAASRSREKRFIATGNLLAAYGQLNGGQIMHYTARDAGTQTGILLPRKFDLSAFIDREPVTFDDPDSALKFMDRGFELTTPDQGMRAILSGAGDRLVLEAAKSKAKGAQYTLNAKLLKAAAPAEFISAGKKMRLTVEGDQTKIRKVVQTVMNQWGLVSHKNKEAARDALNLPSVEEQVNNGMKEVGARRRPTDRAGFIAPNFYDPAAHVVSTMVGAAREVGGFAVDNAVRDLMDRVRHYDTPAAHEAAELGERAINSTKAALGKLAPLLDHSLKITGAGVSPALHKALASLQKIDRPQGRDYGVARIVDAVEGRIAPANAAEKMVIDTLRRLTDATGKMLHVNGVQQLTAKGWQPFNYIPGGKVFVRHYTSDGFGILMRGPAAPGWRQLVDGIAELNDVPRAKVEQSLREVRQGLLGDGPQASFKRINAEFTRQWPRVPTHVWVHGDMIPIFQTFPFLYAKGMAENTAARVGFVKHFGQDTAPGSQRADLVSRFTDETGTDKPLVQMMRALNNVPIEPPLVEAGTEIAKVMRFLHTTGQLFKSGLLTMVAPHAASEVVSNIPAFAGSNDLLRAVRAVSLHPRATMAALESLGALSRDVANLAFQPGRTYASAVRALGQVSSRVLLYKYVFDFQQRLAGAVGIEKAQRMQAGKGNAGDMYDLLRFGWSLADARRLAMGKGTQAEYNRFMRQVPAHLTGFGSLPAEQTRLHHNHFYNAVFAFKHYAESKIRGFLRQVEAYGRAMGSGDPKLMLAANRKFALYQAGTTAAGVLSYFLIALATGGVLGLKVAWNQAKDHPVRFLRDSWLYTLLAGPYGAIIRNTTQGGKINDWLDSALPYFVVHEIVDSVFGLEGYRTLSPMERSGKFIDRILPVNRAVATTAAAFGFGRDEQRLAVAKRAYWRWRYDNYPPDESSSQTYRKDTVFRQNMRLAYQDIIAHRDPNAHINAAFETGKRPQDMAASLRSRLLLSNRALGAKDEAQAEQRRQELHKDIGDEAYRLLEAHDEALYGWALTINPPRPKPIPTGR